MNEQPINDNRESVVEFPGDTKLPRTPAVVLNHALRKNLTDVVIIGQYEDGQYYVRSSSGDVFYINWLLDIVKNNLIKGDPFVEDLFVFEPPPNDAG